MNGNLTELRAIAAEKDANKTLIRLLCDIDEELLIQVISVLKPFDDVTRQLSADKVPTLHLVVPTKVRLQQHLTPNGTDSSLISQLKLHLAVQLDRYFTVTDMHGAATLLDPRLKNNDIIMPAGIRTRAIATLRNLTQHQKQQLELRANRTQQQTVSGIGNSSGEDTVSDESDIEVEPVAKKAKLSEDSSVGVTNFFGDLFTVQEQDVPTDDLDMYLASPG